MSAGCLGDHSGFTYYDINDISKKSLGMFLMNFMNAKVSRSMNSIRLYYLKYCYIYMTKRKTKTRKRYLAGNKEEPKMELEKTMYQHYSFVTSVSFSPDGNKMVSGFLNSYTHQ